MRSYFLSSVLLFLTGFSTSTFGQIEEFDQVRVRAIVKDYVELKFRYDQGKRDIDLDAYLRDFGELFANSKCGHFGSPLGSTEKVYDSVDPERFAKLSGTTFLNRYATGPVKDHFKLDHTVTECLCKGEPHYSVANYINSTCFKRDLEYSVHVTEISRRHLKKAPMQFPKPRWKLPEVYFKSYQWSRFLPGYEIKLVKQPELPPIDFYLVLDDSGSMSSYQNEMKKGFAAFSKKYFGPKYDFHFVRGTTSTYLTGDVSSVMSTEKAGAGAESAFRNLIQVGTSGSGNEWSWDSFVAMTRTPQAKELLREGSFRIVLFLTDEELQGKLSAQEMKAKMDKFFSTNSPDQELDYFTVNIVGNAFAPQFSALSDLIKADKNNFAGELCQNYSIEESDYSRILEDIQTRAIEFLKRFEIRQVEMDSAPECNKAELTVVLTNIAGDERTLEPKEFRVKGNTIQFNRFLNEYLPTVVTVRAYCPLKVSTKRGSNPT